MPGEQAAAGREGTLTKFIGPDYWAVYDKDIDVNGFVLHVCDKRCDECALVYLFAYLQRRMDRRYSSGHSTINDIQIKAV